MEEKSNKEKQIIDEIIKMAQLSTVVATKPKYYLEFTWLGKFLVENGFIPGEDDLKAMAMSKTTLYQGLGKKEYSLLDIYIILTAHAIANDLSFVTNNIKDEELAIALKDVVATITNKGLDPIMKWKVYDYNELQKEETKKPAHPKDMTNAHLRALNGLIYSYIYYRVNILRKYAVLVKGKKPFTRRDVKLFNKILERLGRLSAIEHEQRVIDSLLDALRMLGYNKPFYMKVFDEIYRDTGGRQLGFGVIRELEKRGIKYRGREVSRIIVSYEVYRLYKEVLTNNRVYEDVENIVSEISDVIGTVTAVEFDYERVHRLQPLERKTVLI